MDPRIDTLAGVLDARTALQLPRHDETIEAGVLLVLRTRDPLELLIIKRAEVEGDPWSGHMALPGGRREDRDPDLLRTALRETREETGILVPDAAVFGRLDEVRPRTRRLVPIIIAPFLAMVPAETEGTPSPREVDALIWVPVPALGSEEAVSEVVIDLERESRAFPSLTYNDHVIWGLTHRILTQFLDVAGAAGLV